MKKFPVLLVAAICVTALLTGCAKKDISQLSERMLMLERDVLETRTETASTKEEVRDLELRVDYLEREAVARGVKVPPRVPPTGPTGSNTAGPNMSADTSAQLKNLPPSPAPAAPKADPAKASTKPSDKAKSAPVTPNSPSSPSTPATPASSPSNEAGTAPATLPVVAGGLPSATPTTPASPSTSGSTMPRVSESSPTTPTPPSAPPSAPVQTEKNAYNAALQFYRTGRFAESEAAFQAFLEVYPNSGLVANALYWKGETFYSRGRFADAIFSFKDVQTRFPKHPKTPDSLLKTAMAYGKLGDKANESLHLTVLFEDWPQAEATKRARNMGLKP